MKVGIKASSALKNGHLLIKTGNKEEFEVICSNINEKCGHKKRNPRIILFNVPEDITMDNVAEVLQAQNKELEDNTHEMKPIFQFYDKRKHKNMIVEISSSSRKQLIGKKIKLGWNMCNWQDYNRVT
ncbi:hypothetical protein C0J52_24532 [Blattella germanica]|nr:hypothetical protein C0J52_24532 [Blattella germanica]